MTDLTYIDHPILAISPTTRGFGYAIFQEQLILKEAGIATVKNLDEHLYFKRIDEMVKIYNPSLILIPASDGKYNNKSGRIKLLLEKIKSYGKVKAIMVKSYTRVQIREEFDGFQALTKVQIAEKICRWFPELKKRCPSVRKEFMNEAYSQGLFDAIALVITYYGDAINFHKDSLNA